MKAPVRVAVTGAAGQISYSLLFRVAAGEMLGADQPVILQLLEITPALEALKGMVMEIEDCAFPLVADIVATGDPTVAFKDADYCLLVGARPRGTQDGAVPVVAPVRGARSAHKKARAHGKVLGSQRRV